MGTKNRQRRAEKRRRHQPASSPPAEKAFGRLSLREVIYAAASASRQPLAAAARYPELLAGLAASAGVGPALDAALVDALTRAQTALHWDPYELRRQAERRLGDRHAGYLADVVRGPGSEPLVVEWSAREGAAPIKVLAGAVEVLAMLLSLPPLPQLGGRPSGPARRPSSAGPEPRVLEKVRALLAKAESTTFPEEAEALSAKAQELMARYAIDAAMVGAGAGGPVADDGPTGMRVPVDDPYAGAKSILLSEVAMANRCRAVWSKGYGFSTVMGFSSDLMFVEMLYTSLLVQATSAMVAAGAHVDRSGRSRTRSFRQAFLLAYATRVGHRLREAEQAGRAAATEEYGAALLPVLADRTAAVEAASAAAFPGAVTRSVSVSNAAGWAAGSVAGDLASLSGRAQVPAG